MLQQMVNNAQFPNINPLPLNINSA